MIRKLVPFGYLKKLVNTKPKLFSMISPPANEVVLNETWNNINLDIDGHKQSISPLAREAAYKNGLTIKSFLWKGSGTNYKILLDDVKRQVNPPNFMNRVFAKGLGLHLDSTKIEEKWEETYGGRTATGETEKKGRKVRRRGKRKGANSYTDIPVDNVRKITASRLQNSSFDVPHYYLSMEIEMDTLLQFRRDINSKFELDISMNDFMIKAAAIACTRVPEVKGQWHKDFIRVIDGVDISFAVSAKGRLITPIVKDASRLRLSRVSQETKKLIRKAITNKLEPSEYNGGTMTVSNLSKYNIKSFTSIVNPPQSIILGVAKIEKKLVKHDGELVFKEFMDTTLGCDHRVVDGSIGARWLQEFKQCVENPLKMLI